MDGRAEGPEDGKTVRTVGTEKRKHRSTEKRKDGRMAGGKGLEAGAVDPANVGHEREPPSPGTRSVRLIVLHSFHLSAFPLSVYRPYRPPALIHPNRRPIQIILQRPLDPLSRLNDHALRVRVPRGADRPPSELDLAGLPEHPTRQQEAGRGGGRGDTDPRRLPVAQHVDDDVGPVVVRDLKRDHSVGVGGADDGGGGGGSG